MITLYEKEDRYMIVDPGNPNRELIQEFYRKSNLTPDFIPSLVKAGKAEVKPFSEYIPRWDVSRQNFIENGGYGTNAQQLEFVYDKIKELGTVPGVEAWVAHVDAVKARHPKPT